MNSEYIKKLNEDDFYTLMHDYLLKFITRQDIDLKSVCRMIQTRIQLPNDALELVDFIDKLPDYTKDLYVHKKMKTTEENSLENLQIMLPLLEKLETWNSITVHDCLFSLVEKLGVKNGQILWPIRTALSGKPSSPCGAAELAELLGKNESISRIKKGIEILQ
jgi:glutamyl/glutaminyl-tRNA synthetase